MAYKGSKKRSRDRVKQKQIGFQSTVEKDNNGLFQKSLDFPGFAFRVDKSEDAEFKYSGKVIIPSRLYQKMFLYATNITKEISGLGMVERVGNELHITDLFIIKQEVTTGNTTLNNKDLAKRTMEIIDTGGDPSKMKLWWHSHTNGGMFWSATDERCCDAYNNDQWLLSMVINYKKEIRCRLDIYNPVRITLDYIPVVVEEPINYLSELEEQCKMEMREKVKEASSSYEHNYNTMVDKKEDKWKCPICNFINQSSQIVVSHMVGTHNYEKSDAWQAVEIISEKEEEQPIEDVNKDTPPDTEVENVNFEDLYDESHLLVFHKLSFYDAFKIYWHWDIHEQKYHPIWGKRRLNRAEYAFVAECLATGVKVDKNFNAIV